MTQCISLKNIEFLKRINVSLTAYNCSFLIVEYVLNDLLMKVSETLIQLKI